MCRGHTKLIVYRSKLSVKVQLKKKAKKTPKLVSPLGGLVGLSHPMSCPSRTSGVQTHIILDRCFWQFRLHTRSMSSSPLVGPFPMTAFQ